MRAGVSLWSVHPSSRSTLVPPLSFPNLSLSLSFVLSIRRLVGLLLTPPPYLFSCFLALSGEGEKSEEEKGVTGEISQGSRTRGCPHNFTTRPPEAGGGEARDCIKKKFEPRGTFSHIYPVPILLSLFFVSSPPFLSTLSDERGKPKRANTKRQMIATSQIAR